MVIRKLLKKKELEKLCLTGVWIAAAKENNKTFKKLSTSNVQWIERGCLNNLN
jgi:hypothetical protein